MTLVTDYALGLLCVALAWRLRRERPDPSRSSWAAALAACSVAAFAGGSHHGFLPFLGQRPAAALWWVTLASIGCAAFFATVASARAHLSARWRRRAEIAGSLKLAAYLLLTLKTTAFLLAIIDYSLAFGFVLALHARSWRRTGEASARWIVLGVLVSFLAAAIQAGGVAPHRQFNHNDLYHVVQMAGTWMLYRGARVSVSMRA